MTPEELRRFALAAIDEPEAREVLEDAFAEVEDIVGYRTTADAVYLWFLEGEDPTMFAIQFDEREGRLPPILSEPPRAWLAHALVAVLLFGEWPEDWELAEVCRSWWTFDGDD